MGFAEADPRQLAPSVGTTLVGITISAVPSPASYNSRVRARSNPPEELKIIANLSIAPPRSLGPQLDQVQYSSDYQNSSPTEKNSMIQKASTSHDRETNQDAGTSTRILPEIPLEESQ